MKTPSLNREPVALAAPLLAVPRRRLAAAAFVGMVGTALLLSTIAPLLGPVHRCVLSAAVLLVSFLGWGSVVNRTLCSPRRADFGLRLAWGMACLAAVGGAACLLSLATREFLLALISFGVGWECLELAAGIHTGRSHRPTLSTAVAVAIVALPATLHLYAGAIGTGVSPVDDYAAYLTFPKAILDTGTLIAPFSMHRMAAYGGQSLFQALALLGSANPRQVPVFDIGICLIVVLALIIGDRARRAWAWLPPAALVLTLPLVQLNSTSHLSGVVFFLALYRTATYAGFDPQSPRLAIVLGLVAAAAAALRQSYLVPPVVFLAVFYSPMVRRALAASRPARWSELRPALYALGAFLIFLLPWMLLSFRSNETLLYPLFRGTYRAEYGDLTRANPVQSLLTWFWANISVRWPVRTIGWFVPAALLAPWRLTGGAVQAITLAAFCGFAAIVYGFPLAAAVQVARYYFGFTFAAVLAVTIAACASSPALQGRRYVQLLAMRLFVLVGIVLQLWVTMPMYTAKLGHFYNQVRRPMPLPPSSDREEAYRALQAAVPAGARMVVMFDEPYWLDFRRNPISILDLPGHSSPAPGLPVDDDRATQAYLMTQGFRYLGFVRPKASLGLYQPSNWRKNLRLAQKSTGDQLALSVIWDLAASRYLQFFERLESLMKMGPIVYDDGTMVVLDLGAPTPDSSPAASWW